MGTIKLEPLLVLGYGEGPGRSTASVPLTMLKQIAEGITCPSTLPPSFLAALLHNAYLEEKEGSFSPLPRLAWQTGVPCA